MTAQIADTISEILEPKGVGVGIEAAHQCMTTRGVHKPGVKMVTSRMLGSFRDADIRLAVATTDNRLPAENCLEVLNIESLIEQLMCGDDRTGPRKPDPAVLLDIAESLGEPIYKVIMVGDTVSDLKMAKAAGAMAVAVTGGAGSRDELEQQADVVIDSLAEISVI